MGETTGITWTDHTFNLVIGCTKVSGSRACDHCYAEAFSKRIGLKVWGTHAPRKTLSEKYWKEPIKWNAKAIALGVRRRVFCSSLADVFEDHPTVAQERSRLWPLIEATPGLDWLLLTKRPENVHRMAPTSWMGGAWPRRVWLGVTAEDTEHAHLRLGHLYQVPAPIRFVSYEPALEFVEFSPWLSWLSWIIVGGESGPKARPFHFGWAEVLLRATRQSGTPTFVKQMGDRPIGLTLKAHHGADPSEWPSVLRVQEFPR